MTLPDDAALREMTAALQYPGNQDYDPVTLEPHGTTKRRVDHMEKHLPELLDGGGSLLDLGASKGFVSLWCRDHYQTVHGYEVGTHAHQIAEAVRQRHGADHIMFFNKSFRHVPIGKCTTIPRDSPQCHGPYDVVYAGSVHHHFFKDAILHDAPPWLPFKKLATLAKRYLILDGPLAFEGDTSLPKWEEEYAWTPWVRECYTLENHIRWLEPQFELVRDPVPNERGRHTAVFRRVQPDMRHVEWSAEDIRRTVDKGTELVANKARAADSVVRVNGYRYKFDRGLQTDGVLMVLNSLPDWFASTRYVVTHRGQRIGDVARWVDGDRLRDTRDLREHWLRMNNVLACIGLIEIHLKLGDYIRNSSGHWVDVDIDMVNDVERIACAKDYLSRWRASGTGAFRAFGRKLAHWISNNLADEWVFRTALSTLAGQ